MQPAARSFRMFRGPTKLLLATASAVAFLCPVLLADQPLLTDTFTSAEHTGRRAIRGDWKIAGGEATCTQDDTLYAKYKNHGPIIFYDLPFKDATIRFAFKPEGTKTVVFTANGDSGHIFRAVWNKDGLTTRAFPPAGDKKSISVGKSAVSIPVMNEWQSVEIKLRGNRATIHTGSEQVEAEHASFASPKQNLSIGFSFGSLAIKDLSVTGLPTP